MLARRSARLQRSSSFGKVSNDVLFVVLDCLRWPDVARVSRTCAHLRECCTLSLDGVQAHHRSCMLPSPYFAHALQKVWLGPPRQPYFGLQQCGRILGFAFSDAHIDSVRSIRLLDNEENGFMTRTAFGFSSSRFRGHPTSQLREFVMRPFNARAIGLNRVLEELQKCPKLECIEIALANHNDTVTYPERVLFDSARFWSSHVGVSDICNELAVEANKGALTFPALQRFVLQGCAFRRYEGAAERELAVSLAAWLARRVVAGAPLLQQLHVFVLPPNVGQLLKLKQLNVEGCRNTLLLNDTDWSHLLSASVHTLGVFDLSALRACKAPLPLLTELNVSAFSCSRQNPAALYWHPWLYQDPWQNRCEMADILPHLTKLSIADAHDEFRSEPGDHHKQLLRRIVALPKLAMLHVTFASAFVATRFLRAVPVMDARFMRIARLSSPLIVRVTLLSSTALSYHQAEINSLKAKLAPNITVELEKMDEKAPS